MLNEKSVLVSVFVFLELNESSESEEFGLLELNDNLSTSIWGVWFGSCFDVEGVGLSELKDNLSMSIWDV